MFGAGYKFLIFVFIRTISGQQQNKSSEHLKFGGKLITSGLNLRQGDDNSPQYQLLDIQGGDNVKKLVPKNYKYFDHTYTDDEKNLGPDGPAYLGKSKNGKNYDNTVSQIVNRVQEMTGQQWPMGVVPYYVDKEVYDSTTVKRIVKAMSAIESVSCVVFRQLEKKPKDSPESWLHITNPSKKRDCQHVFETVDGGTEVILGFDCLRPEEILHSLLHALGFRDEVSHPHRDQYIRVLWDNIQPKYRSLFRIRHEDASYKLVEYDPSSIMHFHDRAFSDNGAATIAAIVPGLQIAFASTLSQLDIMRLKLAFSHECNKRNIGDLLITCKNSLIPQHVEELPPHGDDEEQQASEDDEEENKDLVGVIESDEVDDTKQNDQERQSKDIGVKTTG